MGVVTVSSSAARSPVGLGAKFSKPLSQSRKPSILCFKTSKTKNGALVAPQEPASLPVETSKEKQRRKRVARFPERVKVVSTDVAAPNMLELDYNEAAAKLEHIFKHGPTPPDSEVEAKDCEVKSRKMLRRKSIGGKTLVRSQRKKTRRLSLDKRIAMRMDKVSAVAVLSRRKRYSEDEEDEKIFKLVREYSSADYVTLDWKKVKIPPVLPSSEQAWLFKLMQPMKVIFQVKESVKNDLGRVPTDAELARAVNMDVLQLRKNIEVGQAARNKMIKHNLRLVLFVMNKYFQDFTNGSKFEDICQAGVKGLITSIDRFEPRRKFRLSTYGLFWIRHAIIRAMTLSSFTKVSFGLESVRLDIQRAKLELMFELQRMPTEEEVIERVGISRERYNEVTRVMKPVLSLHSKHMITKEEYINGITDVDPVEGDKKKQPALLRLALDDVLDSLKPKESLVIRQRYGLDGKGDRTLGEIAGNLNISREMVRKHEVKALMKLKHPTRVDYLRRYTR